MVGSHDDDWRHALVNLSRDQFASVYPDVDDGWRAILETLFARIRELMGTDPGGSLQILQIKKKFGTLRIEYSVERLTAPTRKAIRLAVDLAEARSACTCECCGETGVLHNDDGSLTTRCAVHANGYRIRLSPSWQNLYIIINGSNLRAEYRRYDRDTDSFITLDPGTAPTLDDR